jgi:hypothetical protein
MSVERRSLHDQLCPVELYLEMMSFVTEYTEEKLNGRPARVGGHFGLRGKEGVSVIAEHECNRTVDSA